MARRGPKPSPQVCVTCKDPLGDSEALEVTGLLSGRVHYVHRPTTTQREMCFRWGVNGADVQSIKLKVAEPSDTTAWNVQSAIELGLDQTACEAVGLRWSDVQRVRDESNQRRVA